MLCLQFILRIHVHIKEASNFCIHCHFICFMSLNTSMTLNDDNCIRVCNLGHLFPISGSCPPLTCLSGLKSTYEYS